MLNSDRRQRLYRSNIDARAHQKGAVQQSVRAGFKGIDGGDLHLGGSGMRFCNGRANRNSVEVITTDLMCACLGHGIAAFGGAYPPPWYKSVEARDNEMPKQVLTMKPMYGQACVHIGIKYKRDVLLGSFTAFGV